MLLPVGTIGYALTAAAWGGSLALAALPAYVGHLPGESAKFYFFEIGQDGGAWLAMAVGIVGLVYIAPWITMGIASAEHSMARALLGPTHEAELAAQVTLAETGRTAAVDSAESERRRIERDLHDGAQQRLVALAANLGWAREKLEQEPEEGREMVAVAHEEAKAALAEIRDLVRGIHPVILEDRGLDRGTVRRRRPLAGPGLGRRAVPQRPPPAVEKPRLTSWSETLTNVTRHSRATRAHVSLARAATVSSSRCVTTVGGADIAGGSGLAGLHDRVAGLGGRCRDQSRRRADRSRWVPVRVMLAEDSVLLREGMTRLLVDAGEEVVATVGAADELLAASSSPARSRRRRRAHAADAHRRRGTGGDRDPRSVAGDRRPRPVAIRRGALRERAAHRGDSAASATFSRTGSPTSARSSTRCAGSASVAPCSTRRS